MNKNGVNQVRVQVGQKRLELGSGSKVSDLLSKLGKASNSVIVIRNGIVLLPDDSLQEGDYLVLRKILAGG
ncbi:MAG: MoaD/ThiS family protein [Candidatus Edwardsbacteria bacterium]